MAADVCQGGACVDAAACGAIAVAEVHVKKIKSTFTGQKGDAVTAQGFVPASVAQLLRRDGQQVAIGGAQTDEVPVTNEVRRKVGKSGKAKIKLKLNPVGKRLLGDFAEQGRSLEVTVRLTVRRRNEPETLLRFLVSVVKKR